MAAVLPRSVFKMNSNSQETLRRIEQNDDQFTELQIGYSDIDGGFISSDYSRLGTAIGNNTHLTKLVFHADNECGLDISNEEFFTGLKRNSSISNVTLKCNMNILIGGVEHEILRYALIGGIGHEILKSYQKINNNLIRLCITGAVLDNGGGNAITETLRWCTNLKIVNLRDNSITDEQLLPINCCSDQRRMQHITGESSFV